MRLRAGIIIGGGLGRGGRGDGKVAQGGLQLVDFRLEFGRLWEPMDNGQEEMRIIIADEMTPDNCRLWDNQTGEKLETLRDSETGLDGHRLVAARLGIMPDAGPRDLQGPKTVQ